MAQFRLTQAAKADILSIGRYTGEEWGKAQRNKYLADLDNRFHQLAKNPEFGKERNEIRPGYRSYPQGRHVIFYRVVGEDIEIVRILHASMDMGIHFDQ